MVAKWWEDSLTRDLRGGFWSRGHFEASLAGVIPDHVIGVILREEEGENVAAVEGGGEVERGLAARVGDVDRGRVVRVDELDGRDWSSAHFGSAAGRQQERRRDGALTLGAADCEVERLASRLAIPLPGVGDGRLVEELLQFGLIA